jgi:hypothetical protein
MEKGRLFALALTFVSVPGVVVACSDSTGSTFGETADAGDETDGNVTPFNPDSTSGPDSTTSVTCIPDTPQNFAPKWNPPTAAKVCTQTVLDEYYDKCLVGAVKGDGGTPCDQWKAANAACLQCIVQANNAGPIQPINNGDINLVNFAACVAVAQNALGENDCAAQYSAAVQCTRASCEFCFGKGGSLTDFNACQNAAKTKGLCKSLDDQIATGACKGYRDAGAPATVCFDGTIGSKSQVTKLIAVVCGP